MVEVTVEQIEELRRLSGAGVLDCRRALEAADGDMAKAVTLLRFRGARH
jgi:elongation factor Ts